MPDVPTTADELRRAFVEFFTERAHQHVPSASVIPVDKSLLFTVAGMVPFKPYFTGEETAPYKRAVSVQKCVRAGGKHNDLDDIGRTNRHSSFSAIADNFSFGHHCKADGTRVPLPKPSIDTRAGLERNLMALQEKSSIWDIDVFTPLRAAAERVTGARSGAGESTDVSLRIIAEHARTMTFMVSDGVRP